MKKGDSLIFRKPKNRIEEILKHEMLKKRLNTVVRKEKVFNHFMGKLKSSIPIQIILGFIACFLMYRLMGGEKLIEVLLSWTIGMTVIAAFITSILSKYHKEKQ